MKGYICSIPIARTKKTRPLLHRLLQKLIDTVLSALKYSLNLDVECNAMKRMSYSRFMFTFPLTKNRTNN